MVSLALAGWFGHYAYLRITLRPTPRPEYWAAQIAALDPPPPGAISSEKAAAILANRPWESDPAVVAALSRNMLWVLWTLQYGPWDDSRADVRAVRGVLASAAFGTARDELRQTVEIGWRDAPNLHLAPQYNALNNHYLAWTAWLSLHSRWSLEEYGDIETAVVDRCLIVALTRQCRQHRSGHAALPAKGGADLTAVARDPGEQPPESPVEARVLMHTVDNLLQASPSLHARLSRERALTMADLESMYVREAGDWLDVGAAAERFLQTALWGGSGRPLRLWNLASPLFHDHPTACARVNRAMVLLNAADTMVSARAAQPMLDGSALGPLDGFAIFDVPDRPDWSGIAEFLVGEYTSRTEIDAALALLALGEYRRRVGRDPDSLDELVPEFLPRLPIDYADRQPLRYRRTPHGFLLYSIGQNGVDDGGAYAALAVPWSTENLDAVFADEAQTEDEP